MSRTRPFLLAGAFAFSACEPPYVTTTATIQNDTRILVVEALGEDDDFDWTFEFIVRDAQPGTYTMLVANEPPTSQAGLTTFDSDRCFDQDRSTPVCAVPGLGQWTGLIPLRERGELKGSVGLLACGARCYFILVRDVAGAIEPQATTLRVTRSGNDDIPDATIKVMPPLP